MYKVINYLDEMHGDFLIYQLRKFESLHQDFLDQYYGRMGFPKSVNGL